MIDKKEFNKMVVNNLIEQEIKDYFGDRYYNTYSRNTVTHEEFVKLKDLIFKCIEHSNSNN